MTDEERILQRIGQLRRGILYHSCLYYTLDLNIISDRVFDLASKELVDLQRDHPELSERVEFEREAFRGWSGEGGSHLPIRSQAVVDKALTVYYRLTGELPEYAYLKPR